MKPDMSILLCIVKQMLLLNKCLLLNEGNERRGMYVWLGKLLLKSLNLERQEGPGQGQGLGQDRTGTRDWDRIPEPHLPVLPSPSKWCCFTWHVFTALVPACTTTLTLPPCLHAIPSTCLHYTCHYLIAPCHPCPHFCPSCPSLPLAQPTHMTPTLHTQLTPLPLPALLHPATVPLACTAIADLC